MFFNAKNGTLKLSDGSMDYVCFGKGKKVLIMLPGLGDSLRSVKGTALPLAIMYKEFSNDYKVYMFSRKAELPHEYSTAGMADDQIEAMDILGIDKADIVGVSMGGMIAQHMAAKYPERIGKLVLVVTASRPNPVLTGAIEEWISCAEQNDHTAFMDSNVRLIYTEEYYKKSKLLIPIMGKFTKPRSYERFFTMAKACMEHGAYEFLPNIKAETLIIGGRQDKCVGHKASVEIAERIPGSQLYIYDEYGHGLYEEAKDFNQRLLSFLKA